MSAVIKHLENRKCKTKARGEQEVALGLQIQRDAVMSSSRALTYTILSLHPLFADWLDRIFCSVTAAQT